MEEMQILKKLINLVRITMRNTQYEIRILSTLSGTLPIKNGVREGNALACLLFNIALEKVIRDAKIDTRGNIFYTSVQIFACADDIDIVGSSQAAMIEAFITLEKAAKEIGLQVNQEKTKYIPVTKKSHAHIPLHI
jgi:sorting nexin-29